MACISNTSNYVAARDALAKDYDQILPNSMVGRAQQDSVWRELDGCFAVGQRVLEIDCSTGVDTTHLAERGVSVWACEGSSRMLEVARHRIDSSHLRAPVVLHRITAHEIARLLGDRPFDGAFCNWGALNCVEDVAAVARSLATLLKPGATVVLCMAGTLVGWEVIVCLRHMKLREAFHRLGRGPYYGRLVDDFFVPCWYPSVREISRVFRPSFRLLRWRGVGVAVPPVFLERHAKRHPRAFNLLVKIDPLLGQAPLVRALADHLLLTFEKGTSLNPPTAD
ncbi:MAG: class I SAM-dependent methyltransferase [Terriglobia bacterium]